MSHINITNKDEIINVDIDASQTEAIGMISALFQAIRETWGFDNSQLKLIVELSNNLLNKKEE